MIWIDGHVHFHSCFSPEQFFLHAAKNFANAATRSGVSGVPVGILAMVEASGVDFYSQWRASTGQEIAPGLGFRSSDQEDSLEVLIEDEVRLLVVPGRQIQTSDGLEVLAIGTIEHFENGASIKETLPKVCEANALAVIPWGFGKWWFERGRIVRSLLESEDGPEFLLGDNGGRIRWSREPHLFDLARQLRIGVLPGSDPLPFPSQVDRAGRRGARLDSTLSLARTVEGLKKALWDRSLELIGFGDGENVGPFVRNQMALQVKRRWSMSIR